MPLSPEWAGRQPALLCRSDLRILERQPQRNLNQYGLIGWLVTYPCGRVRSCGYALIWKRELHPVEQIEPLFNRRHLRQIEVEIVDARTAE